MPAAVQNVDQIAKPNGYEAGRQAFISSLRKSVLFDVGGAMKQTYLEEVEPKLAKAGKVPATGREVRDAMEDRRVYKFYTSIRTNAQEMVFESVRPQLERNASKLIAAAADARAKNPAGGSLRLNPDLKIPRHVSEVDVHLMPGCFHTEHAPDDVLQGARNTYGTWVFGGQLKAWVRGPAETIAQFLKVRYPDFQPKVMLDLGCTAGSNTFPYKETFPDADVHGIDVAAPGLRYGHARAEAMGLKIEFSQQDAQHLDFADNSVDFITSSFFFHELPVKVTKAILAECHRVLKPGGLMLHFELAPSIEVDAYQNFFLDWDTWHNNEPSYQQFRAQDPRDLVIGAGFTPDKYEQHQLLNVATVTPEEFRACAFGEVKVKPAFGGVSWFTFGGWK